MLEAVFETINRSDYDIGNEREIIVLHRHDECRNAIIITSRWEDKENTRERQNEHIVLG